MANSFFFLPILIVSTATYYQNRKNNTKLLEKLFNQYWLKLHFLDHVKNVEPMKPTQDQMGKKNGKKLRQVLFVNRVPLKTINQEHMFPILELHDQVHV